MISPFAHINAATIRAERRAQLIARITTAAIYAALTALALIVIDTAMTTALALPDTLAQAETLKGM